MKQPFSVALCVVLLSTSALAESRSITLAVPGMTCPTCPVTLKKALLKERGVSSVTVVYEKKELVVEFDDAKTTSTAIMKSTASVGFPSQLAK